MICAPLAGVWGGVRVCVPVGGGGGTTGEEGGNPCWTYTRAFQHVLDPKQMVRSGPGSLLVCQV